MEHQNRLKALADDELLAALSRIVGKRNQVTAEFLAYLAELDERQLFLDLGYPSLFAYCVDALGLCESTAGRHIAAARVCRDHAHAFELVARGELHASALSLMKKYVTAENAAELFELCKRQSARQVEELLAARFPRPDVRDLIRRLPVVARPIPDVGSEVSSAAAPEAPVADDAPAMESRTQESGANGHSELPKSRRLEPLSADRYGVHFTADGEFRDLLERVRGLAGHRLPSGDILTLVKRGLEAYERELEKERFAVSRKARARARALCGKRKRHHAAAVAREVFVRDGKQCSYVSPDGRRCSSRVRLELDHVQPWALGGVSSATNLRLRCRAHNQRYARQCFGELHIRAARARKLRSSRHCAIRNTRAPTDP
ncbi:MAG: HNH endonuclease signature motif containing protein [Myxococcales bacterium]